MRRGNQVQEDVFKDGGSDAVAENVLVFNKTKSEVPWPKLLGCLSYQSTNESDDDFLLLNDP